MDRTFTSEQVTQIGEIAKDAMISLNLNYLSAQHLVHNPHLASRLKTLFEGLSMLGSLVAYDQSLGLATLLERAVGPTNLKNIDPNITPEHFKFSGAGVRKLSFRVEPCLEGETCEWAAVRLANAGFTLGNIRDLAAFFHYHPMEMQEWIWVFALSEDSRWEGDDEVVYVPCAGVEGSRRYFGLNHFHHTLLSGSGVLVACE